MNKIPTAEEFSNNYRFFEDRGSEINWSNIYKFSRDFAKLHVQAALKEVLEKAKKDWKDKSNGYSYQDITEESIINIYDLNNIK